jgi:tRNA threonylcarbamoyladenosine modification (KEOPS) complex  Pcc1 subunit
LPIKINITEIKKILKEERMKHEIQYKIGTSSEGFMGREEDKQLTYHFKELLNELKKTNIHSLNENINGNHLSNLYEIGKDEHKWPEFDYNEPYQQQVFNLLSFSPFAKTNIPVSDFLKQYILLENKIKMKKEEAEDIYHQLRKASKENEDQLNKYISLPYKDNSIQLGVAVFEVSNLKINDNNNLYVIKLSIDNHSSNTTNASPCINNTIIYNQNYKFEL